MPSVVSLQKFLAFVGNDPERRWQCDAEHSWTLKDASQAAFSIFCMLGEPAITAGDPELEAFGRWCSLFGSKKWRKLSLRAVKIADGILGPPADHYLTSWDDPVRGWDRSSWKPTSDHVRRLNAWVKNILVDLNRARESGRQLDETDEVSATESSKPAAADPVVAAGMAPELRPATDSRIEAAITRVYDEAEKNKTKPPNINEVVGPVQTVLKEAGKRASGKKIKELAGAEKHAKRRGPTGERVSKRS